MIFVKEFDIPKPNALKNQQEKPENYRQEKYPSHMTETLGKYGMFIDTEKICPKHEYEKD